MADRTPYPDPNAGMPGWLKMLGIILLILVLLVVAAMIVTGSGGGHVPPIKHGV